MTLPLLTPNAQNSSRASTWRLAALLLLTSLLGGCSSSLTRRPECRLPARTLDSSPRFVLSAKAYYLQGDPRWASDPIGGSGKPLRRVGCTLCCLSMALAQYDLQRTPGELNRDLKRVDGFTEKGWVRWAAIEAVTAGCARIEIVHHATLRDIQAALARRQPVLVKVAPAGIVQHWVLLVGRDRQEFLMKDPLDQKRTLQPLSSLGSEILAVRIAKRKVAEAKVEE